MSSREASGSIGGVNIAENTAVAASKTTVGEGLARLVRRAPAPFRSAADRAVTLQAALAFLLPLNFPMVQRMYYKVVHFNF